MQMIPPSDSAAGGLINNLPVHLASTFSKCLYAWEHTSDHCFCVYGIDSYCIYLFIYLLCHLIVFTIIGHAILFSETFEMDTSEDRASKIKNKK